MMNTGENLRYQFHGHPADNITSLNVRSTDGPQISPRRFHAKAIYSGLLKSKPAATVMTLSRRFLAEQLITAARTAAHDSPPADMDDLALWMQSNTAAVGRQYRYYLAARQRGGARRYFPTKSHALHFLKAVAPTKLVDGAWLYGLVSQWRDLRYTELIRIYLEELGEGEPDKNHVVIYRKLLAANDCGQWENQPDSRFVQGAIQLSLAHHAREFLPEVIGFNLGYEQLPLHLLICAYELAELGIDPYYFTLHVTVDNAATGHAAKAVQSVFDTMPQLGDKQAFYRRVRNGYQLNALGDGTEDVIANFNLEQELYDILAAKARIGADLHSDYCRVAGRTITEWLHAPEQIPEFVRALEQAGWIRRHEPPQHSRFWKLLAGEKAAMFGVFNAYERQVISDWIAGDSLQEPQAGPRRAQFRQEDGETGRSRLDGDFDNELRLLRDKLAGAPSDAAAMELLVQWLSPARHPTPPGLLATRIFIHRLGLHQQAAPPSA